MALPIEQSNLFPPGDSSVRLRKDLQFVTIRRGLQLVHVVKDPVNLKYFEIDEHEFDLLLQLDGKKTWEEIRLWFNHRFPPLRLSYQALTAMIWRLYQQGLLVSVASGQGRRVAERTRQGQRQEWVQRLSQPWIIRLPGINPGPWLGLANRLMGWVFSPMFVCVASIGLLLLLGIIVAQHQAIARMETDSSEFFSPGNLLLLTVAIIATKLFHELGHAVAAYRHGCECHEMGVLLLAGLPSMYCDVSDAWTLPDRWQRITVSLAGVWVEILIASLAFGIWTTSVPGIIHALSLNIMVVCSVGTVMFNVNPLVRYDGYYVLMDLAGISNLGQRSSAAISRIFSCWVLGSTDGRRLDSVALPRWCLAYAVTSIIYRVMLTFAVLWGLHLALKPFSLGVIVWMLAIVGLSFWGLKMTKSGREQIRATLATGTPKWRVMVGLLILSGGVITCLAIPLPRYVLGDAVMEPMNRQTLVTAIPGQLKQRKDAGASVTAGEVLATFDNQDIQREIQKLEADVQSQREHLEALSARRNQDLRAAGQLPAAQTAMAALEHRLAFLFEERRRLEIRAVEDSVIYPAPLRLENREKGELTRWSGSLLDPINKNVWAEAGDTFCQVGTIDRLEAIAILAQDDLEAVRSGQRVDILLRSSGKMVSGEIAKISSIELGVKDDTTIDSNMPRTFNQQGRGERHRKWYQVQIHCRSPLPAGTMVRSRSKVRIHVGTRTIGQWIAVQFFKTFRWHA